MAMAVRRFSANIELSYDKALLFGGLTFSRQHLSGHFLPSRLRIPPEFAL